MQSDNSADYYRMREQGALALARAARDPQIAAIHLEMAEEYGRRATLSPSRDSASHRLAAG